MYCAYITTIKELRKHNDADRLQVATVFGNDVVVDLSYEAGKRVIYFPTDGQLGKEFAEENNLVRKKDENGNNIGGYLDPDKRNVRAITLRGEKSDGLLLPIEMLSKYVDITTLKDGDQITILNGVEICRKYIPKSNKKPHVDNYGKKPKKNKKEEKYKVSYDNFIEHYDTEQLAYNQQAFKPGDIIYLTRKLHGCFAKGTKIRMADGSLKRIERIKPGEYVLGFNLQTKKVEKTRVINTFVNPPSDKWNEIRFSRDGFRGDKRGKFISTSNHPYWCEEENRWIQAKDLKVGMNISTLFYTPVLTSMQKDILVGSLLGDGCLLSFDNKTCEMQVGCKKENEEYLDYIVQVTNGLYYKRTQTYISGYGSQIVRAKTYRSADIYDYFEDAVTFNNHGNHKLKNGLINKFTDLSLAIFYMEDGSLSHNDFQKDRANFAVCDYSDSDLEIIVKCFDKFGITAVNYKDPNGYNRIRLNTKDAYKMFDLIYKYIPPIMRYKLPEEYRNKEFSMPVDEEEYKKSFVLRQQKILENNPTNIMRVEYDLETELHNYIVVNAIVHNTSARTANTIEIVIKKKPKILKKIFRCQDRIYKKYKVISGTRRVTLRDYEGGYYGNNQFRKKYNDYFENKLPKGMTVFYEIVGWVNDTTPIMPRCDNSKVKDKEFSRQYGEETIFTYGCEPGENKCFIYRITMTNEDGVIVELPTEETIKWCERLGCEYVPLLDKFLYTTWEDLNERVNKHLDIPEPLADGKHITEGVVVRIDNRSKFTAYKAKSYSFKILEGIIKDEADAPDMEEAEAIIEEE